ncbi:peptide chain release factor N(5)-glutamine methyltransferase [Ekhidna sp.]|uniref:peptide chain release factor N(5)-glutamine methyltransferase n=1 Tax=Ekhidna sp. TaxID=2608089 RepID=UPI0032EBC114
MKNVKQIWQETVKQLEKVYDRREAENITYLLLEDAFSVSKTDILFEAVVEIASDQLNVYIQKLLQHEPIQYVTGIADFYGRRFHIEPGALIPRPETEELVGLILKENQVQNPRILDVGVGSGCIALTLALELDTQVYGTDVSEEAIAIARKNAQQLGAKTQLYHSDILKEDLPESNLDILVSNPPYIPQKEFDLIAQNVTWFEPEMALFVPNRDPILFYKRIADAGLNALKSGGKLYFEIHENFGNEVKTFLENAGYSEVNIHQDMQGKHRMVSALNG